MESEKRYSKANIRTKYLDMRVDFLDGEELNVELAMRNIIIIGDMSRRRRILREAIKQEKEQGPMEKIPPLSPEQEIQICEAKVGNFEISAMGNSKVAPKNQTLLLHLSHRLIMLCDNRTDDFIHQRADELLTRVIEHLNCHFGNSGGEIINQPVVTESTGLDDGNGALIPVSTVESTPDSDLVPPSGETTVDPEMIECLRKLGIIDNSASAKDHNSVRSYWLNLERELSMLRIFMAQQEAAAAQTNPLEKNPQSQPLVTSSYSPLHTGAIPKVTSTTTTNTVVTCLYSRPITTPYVGGNDGIYSDAIMPHSVGSS